MKTPKFNIIPDKKLVQDDVVMSGKDKGKREVDPRPQFSINAEEFPEIKDWSTGSKYKIMIEVEQVGSEIGEWGDDKGKMTARFKINAIASMHGDDKKETKEENKSFPKGMVKEKK